MMIHHVNLLRNLCCGLASLALACSASGSGSSIGTPPAQDASAGGNDAGPGFQDVLVFDATPVDGVGPALGQLQGKVSAPNGTIPISGALVYLSPGPPGPIPDGVFCDECVKFEPGDDYALSRADGSFTLGVHTTGHRYLVVQKGQFRRVRELDVVTGTQNVNPELTRLPNRMDKAAGDDIPRMAVVTGEWDAIENSLAKLGLGTIVNGPLPQGPHVDRATAPFDIIEEVFPPSSDPLKNQGNFLRDWETIKKYHIIFLPCGHSEQTTCTDRRPDDKTIQANLQRFVKEGGKLYTTDYAYEYLRRPWPGYVSWTNETSSTGSACLDGFYDRPASVQDQDMKLWLAAQGISDFELQKSWTEITDVHERDGLDHEGNAVAITPKVWVNGGTKPATVSFGYQCGRVLFSTYHTTGDAAASTLLPQEIALLYVLLEVGVCVGEPVPPK